MEQTTSLNKMAAQATLHCLSGCAIGEILGLLIGTALSLPELLTIALAIALAFTFGFSLTIRGLLKHGLEVKQAAKVAFASDALSITVMEIVANTVMLIIPGAMNHGLINPWLWVAMIIALGVAYLAALPVNRWLLQRGKGHALVHQYHSHH